MKEDQPNRVCPTEHKIAALGGRGLGIASLVSLGIAALGEPELAKNIFISSTITTVGIVGTVCPTVGLIRWWNTSQNKDKETRKSRFKVIK